MISGEMDEYEGGVFKMTSGEMDDNGGGDIENDQLGNG